MKDADVFLVRTILHSYSDDQCVQILRHLRDSAAPSSQLIIIDNIMSCACIDEDLGGISGADSTLQPPPTPLLPNYGHANSLRYTEDILMMEMQDSRERTLKEFIELLRRSAWKLDRVVQSLAPSAEKIIAVPA